MVALGAIWGSSFLFIKIGVSELPPMFVALGRVLGGAVALLVVSAVTRDRLPRDPRPGAHNAVVAVVGVAGAVHPVRVRRTAGLRRCWPGSGTP